MGIITNDASLPQEQKYAYLYSVTNIRNEMKGSVSREGATGVDIHSVLCMHLSHSHCTSQAHLHTTHHQFTMKTKN